jgi:hypothetical protein
MSGEGIEQGRRKGQSLVADTMHPEGCGRQQA